jgi:hypothetical protein
VRHRDDGTQVADLASPNIEEGALMYLVRMSLLLSMTSAMMIGCGQVETTSETTSETAQAIASCAGEAATSFNCRCAGCGANGLSQAGWNAMFAEADRNALNGVTAWDWNHDGPIAMCEPGTSWSNGCDLATPWRTWIGTTGRHVEMITELVKVIAVKTYAVRHPGGNTYHGEFGLAPAALHATWSYADQEIASAAMLALLDAVHDVPICLKTERTPDNCVGSGAIYHESTTFGSTFRMHYAAISGGAAAPDPLRNPRFKTVDPSSATTFKFSESRCSLGGSGVSTLASSCTDQLGRAWNWPVVVLTPTDPSWYYGQLPPFTRPSELPPVL